MKRSKKIVSHCLVCFFIVLPFLVQAQKGYEEGYIITNEGDTITGMVKDRKDGFFLKLYKKIHFKGNRKHKRFSPEDIIGYKQGDRIYESLWIKENSPKPFKTELINWENSGEKHFMKVIVKGPLSNYYLEYIDGEYGYLEQTNLLLKEGEDYFLRVSIIKLGKRNKDLFDYIYDCPELIQKVQNKEIRYASDVARYYNKWKSIK